MYIRSLTPRCSLPRALKRRTGEQRDHRLDRQMPRPSSGRRTSSHCFSALEGKRPRTKQEGLEEELKGQERRRSPLQHSTSMLNRC